MPYLVHIEYAGTFNYSELGSSSLRQLATTMSVPDSDKDHVLTKRGERRVFMFIAVFLFPVLSIVLVGGYGFLIWMMQLIFGPPGSN